MPEIKIDKKKINNQSYKVYIIAEAGLGHFSSLNNAKKLVDLAARSGADAVKFQAYKTEQLISKDFRKWFVRYKKKEVNLNFFKIIKSYCKKKNITFLLTPHTEEAIKWIKELDLPAIKIGSGEIGNFKLLNEVIKLKKPLIVSTGMHDYNDLLNLKKFFSKKKFKKIIFLKCRTVYPTLDKEVNLSNFNKFNNIFKNYIVGYSDHSDNDLAIVGSIFFGARVVEKHISIKFNIKNAQDWKVSFNLKEMTNFVEKVRRIEKIMGDKNIFVTKSEKNSKIWASKSIFTRKKIQKNQKIKINDIKLLRPGNGIPAKFFFNILGKKVKKNLNKNIKLEFNDIKK